jgi:DNA-3-methyladenine glycosylase
MILPEKFYSTGHVTDIARNLLGKVLYTFFDNELTGGKIVEAEAYCGQTDRASHAFKNKLTPRTRTMFGKPGTAYVYLCYGIHELFNVVTNINGMADAVLIRAIEPVVGFETIKIRRNINSNSINLTSGPGKLSKALKISRNQNGIDLTSKTGGLWIEKGIEELDSKIIASKRIGVDYAGPDAALPWRFYLESNKWVSN